MCRSTILGNITSTAGAAILPSSVPDCGNESEDVAPSSSRGESRERLRAWGAYADFLVQVIGSSNRGGRRVRKRTLDQAGLTDNSVQPSRESPAVAGASEQAQKFPSESISPSHARSGWSQLEYGQANNGIEIDLNPPTPDDIMLDPALQAADASAREVSYMHRRSRQLLTT